MKQIQVFFRKLLRPLDRLFDHIYTSKYNPLYQSGTLAIALMSLTLGTGFYLLYFYRLGTPYESIVDLQNNLFWGRWVRALHRYTSDAAVVAVIAHVFRMISEGKTWGPRTLAWMTGVFVTWLMLFVGWTGYVLVWDQQAQALALAGAEMVNVIPLFEGVILRALSGATAVGSSFFFLNLFLHMSIPLGMIIVLWLHTSKLQRPVWFPKKKLVVLLTISFVLLSISVPAPLGGPANLLIVNKSYSLDIFYSFVIPLVAYFGPLLALLFLAIKFFGNMAIPFLLKPRQENELEKSKHNQLACTGCNQCAEDCPFDAIEMVPRTQWAGDKNLGSEKVAFVLENACVGCGLCSGSCSQMAIGPQARSSKIQIQAIKNLMTQYPKGSQLFIHCANNSVGLKIKERLQSQISSFATYEVPCAGILHMNSLSIALNHFQSIGISSCAPRACTNREGQYLLEQRVLFDRDPQPVSKSTSKSTLENYLLAGPKFRQGIRLCTGGLSEVTAIEKELLQLSLNSATESQSLWKQKEWTRNLWTRKLQAVGLTVVVLGALALGSSLPYKSEFTTSFLRLSLRVPATTTEVCRTFSDQEKAQMPAHMRKSQDCTRQAIPFLLKVRVDSKEFLQETLSPLGSRGDKPVMLDRTLPIVAGEHKIEVFLTPEQSSSAEPTLHLDFASEFEIGKALLIGYEANKKILFFTKDPIK